MKVPAFVVLSALCSCQAGLASRDAQARVLAQGQAAGAIPIKVVPPCGPEKRAEVLARATAVAPGVALDCSLTLGPADLVTKRIVLRGRSGSGVRLDCRGATIDGRFHIDRDTLVIQSRKVDGTWQPATNVAVTNCRIIGSVRIRSDWSVDELKAASRRADYVTRIRAAAPRRISLSRLHVTAIGRTPLYVHTGVSEVRLTNSVLDGTAVAAGIYLDAESTGHVIKDNELRVVSTAGREEISVDGSSYNLIAGNRFSTLDTGGIYLYRNCGERGVVRHSWPRGNVILNNTFYYDQYTGSNPAIYLGSRDGSEGYCDEDEDSPLGSGSNDRSYARYNVLMQNRVFKRSLDDVIRVGGDGSNIGNVIARFPEPGYNETVGSASPRPSGCYRARGYKSFFAHGEAMDVYIGDRGRPECGGLIRCGNGEWSEKEKSDCRIRRVAGECARADSNAGCDDSVGCSGGEVIVGAYGACNLEGTTIGNGEIHGIESVPLNTFSVLRASDNPSDGWCQVGNNGIRVGNAPIDGALGRPHVTIRCREHDSNGGDCKVRAVFYCR